MKTHNIKGKDVSEETIVEALKKHCGFEEPRVDVYDFSACLSYNKAGFYLGGKKIKDRIDEEMLKRDTTLGYYTKSDVKKIIQGLQEMVDYLEKQ